MSFKITIINNENGEVLANEENAVAIVGAITNEEATAQMAFVNCDTIKLANAIHYAEGVTSKIRGETPKLNLLLALSDALDNKNENHNN